MLFALLFLAALLAAPLHAEDAPVTPEPPTTWIDKDTGHRVWRLSNEPNSSALYFELKTITPDNKTLIYLAPDGIHALDLATKKTRLLLRNESQTLHASVLGVGRTTNSVFFKRWDTADPAVRVRVVCKLDVYTGEVTKLATLPRGWDVNTVNADETLAAGFYEEGPHDPNSEYGAIAKPALGPDGKPLVATGGLVQAANKGEMITRRFAAKIPVVLYTINFQTGKTTTLLHSTDWLDHFIFSPTDPTLLMYGHQGPWQLVDPLWTIRTDGSGNTMVHKRQMDMEIAGHAWWGDDGKHIWYDLQTPLGKVFWVAGYNVETRKRTWYKLERNQWSVHYNSANDESLFCGDGGNPEQVAKAPDGKWIELFRPETEADDNPGDPEVVQHGVLHFEHLVNMAKHNYSLEPNVRFTPDKKMVIFTGNMFGPSYVFGVEVDKSLDSQ